MNTTTHFVPISRTHTTKETNVSIQLICDVSTLKSDEKNIEVETPVPFFSHMLTSMLFHGAFSGRVQIQAHGDARHMVENVGIVLGDILAEYAFIKQPIRRFGHAITPVNDALAECAIDICNRAFFHYDVHLPQEHVGAFNVALAQDFFHVLAENVHMNLHLIVRHGLKSNSTLEALFKSCGRALHIALQSIHANTIQSTKGVS